MNLSDAIANDEQKIRTELQYASYDELKAYAREHGIRLYTKVPSKMLNIIAETQARRMHHGDAFRD